MCTCVCTCTCTCIIRLYFTHGIKANMQMCACIVHTHTHTHTHTNALHIQCIQCICAHKLFILSRFPTVVLQVKQSPCKDSFRIEVYMYMCTTTKMEHTNIVQPSICIYMFAHISLHTFVPGAPEHSIYTYSLLPPLLRKKYPQRR